MKDFSSKPAKDATPVEVRAVKFSLDKVEYTATYTTDAESVLAWSELAAETPGEADLESQEGVAFVSRYFQLALGDSEYRRFRAHLKRLREAGTPAGPDVLEGIMEFLEDSMREDVEDAAERPTTPSSHSSDGREVKDERISVVASIEDGEVAVAPRPNRNQRRAADRRMAREAAQAG